jgi:hypothetical protein
MPIVQGSTTTSASPSPSDPVPPKPWSYRILNLLGFRSISDERLAKMKATKVRQIEALEREVEEKSHKDSNKSGNNP